MACMISLSLRDSALDLEKSSHPSHDAWFKSLALFRDMGLDNPRDTISRGASNYSYCCVDQEQHQEVIYLYCQCSPEKIKNIEAQCISENSKLRRVLSPLLRTPLSTQSIARLDKELNLIYPALAAGHATKHLELLTFCNQQKPMILSAFLEPHCAAGSRANLAEVPVKSYSTTRLDGEEKNTFYCIEWQNFEERTTLLSSHSLRKQMKSANAQYRSPFLQALGKEEEELTWEEDFDIFLKSTGASAIERRAMIGKFVTDDYLRLQPKRGKASCVIQ